MAVKFVVPGEEEEEFITCHRSLNENTFVYNGTGSAVLH